MWNSFAILAILLATFIPLSVQSPTHPSSVPNCFVCPYNDLAGHPLSTHSHSNSELFCRYKTVPDDFFCKYFTNTGVLKQDHDQGYCPYSASIDCARKRRSVLPRSPYATSPEARSPKPDVMTVRSRLGMKKRSKTQEHA